MATVHWSGVNIRRSERGGFLFWIIFDLVNYSVAINGTFRYIGNRWKAKRNRGRQMATQVIATFTNADDMMTSFVTVADKGFNVSLRDDESMEFASFGYNCPTVEMALAKAQTVIK